LARWCQRKGQWALEIAECDGGLKGFKALPKR
jgi:hypothetical protein